ncbi:MAG: response regulator [Elusimicrobiota bacterium]
MEPKKRKVLVVDDDMEVVDYLKTLLEGKGYNVITSYDGKDAIEKARKEKPGIILLDFIMPGISGMEVCRILKTDAQTKQIPVILLSNVGSLDIIKTFLQMGVEDYIVKPPDPQKLLDKIDIALEMKGGII